MQQNEHPQSVWFAVSSKGVSIVEADHPHGVYKFWSYREVANWGNTKQNFHLVAGNLQKPEKRSFTSAYSAHVRGHRALFLSPPPPKILLVFVLSATLVARRTLQHMWRCNEAGSCSHATHSRSVSRFVICRFLRCTLASPAGPAVTPTSRRRRALVSASEVHRIPFRGAREPSLLSLALWCIVGAACCWRVTAVPLMRQTNLLLYSSILAAFLLLTSEAPRCLLHVSWRAPCLLCFGCPFLLVSFSALGNFP
jgi:hypothetical protein